MRSPLSAIESDGNVSVTLAASPATRRAGCTADSFITSTPPVYCGISLHESSFDTRNRILYSPSGSVSSTTEREHVLSARSIGCSPPHFAGFVHSRRISGRMSVESA